MAINSRSECSLRVEQYMIRWMLRWPLIVLVGLIFVERSSAQVAKKPTGIATGQSKRIDKSPPLKEPAKPDFEEIAPQGGDQLPALQLTTVNGDEQNLSDAWHGGPALLVTSSLTCPKSRSRWPELKKLIEKYKREINVVVVYVIEAHPVGSVCPYKGVEDITPENERDGILRRQPTTLEERLALAEEFKRYLRIDTQIYVDNMDNQAWKAFGAAPNLALLVDSNGVVEARTGWFDGKTTGAAIDAYLASFGPIDTPGEAASKADETVAVPLWQKMEDAGFDIYDFRDWLGEKDTRQLSAALKKVRELANIGFEAEQGHSEETTALMECVLEDNLAAAKVLLAHGARLDIRTRSFQSVLQLAAQRNKIEFVKLLLANKADPNFPRSGESPLHEACLRGYADIAKLLLGAGAKEDFFSQVALGDVESVRKTLKADASWALRADGANRLPLDYAAANGRTEIASVLLLHGAPVVKQKRMRIDPPLHRAINRDDVAMVRLLLTAGSSPDTSVGYGGEAPEWQPAIHLAIAKGSLPIVKLLLEHKVDLSARNTYSKTPLHEAAGQGEAEIVRALIAAGADVNALQLGYSLPCGSGEEEKPSNNTPLHLAAARGNVATIKVLLVAGANVNARNKKGRSSLDFVNAPSSPDNRSPDEKRDIIELLEKNGAKPGSLQSGE